MGLVVFALFRDSMRNPGQLVLTVLSVTMGVCVIVGVDIANHSAMAEFHRADRVISGAATHRLTGGTNALDESIYRLVRVDAGIRAAAPVIHVPVSLSGQEGDWSLIGVDPFSDFRLRELGLDRGVGGNESIADALPWPIYLPQHLMSDEQGPVIIEYRGQQQRFNPVGTLRMRSGDSRLLVSDIAWAQDFLGMQGEISYIDLRLESKDEPLLRALLPDHVRLIDLGIQHSARQEMSRAFRTNLTALSLLAFVVAMFLVYSAVSFQVVRRRKLLGLFASMGVTSGQFLGLLLVELMVLAAVGTACGILLGVVLAETLTGWVGVTINTLYYRLVSPVPILEFWTLFKALAVGLAGSVLAGLVPAWAVSRESPVCLLRETGRAVGWRSLAPRWLPWSLGLSVCAALLVGFSGNSLVLPFAGLFLLICALSMMGPWLLHHCLGLAGLQGRHPRWLIPRLAIRNAGRHLDRTGVAVAALSVAVSATLGVELMIQSFRYSVEDWLEHYLRADIYLSARGSEIPFLTENLIGTLQALPMVRSLSTGNRLELETPTGPVTVFVLDTPPAGFAGFRILEGETDGLWSRFQQEGEVLVSEPLSRRMGLAPGAGIRLPTDRGMQSFTIAAVYRDYSSDQGLVTMDVNTWNRFFDSFQPISAALYLEPESDVKQVIEMILAESTTPSGLYVRSNRDLRQESLSVFDQTFRITEVLRWLSVIVAVVGVLSALMALLLERRWELDLLSRIGFSRGQVSGMLVLEAGLIGFVAGLVAIPLGVLLSLILIHVINVRSFGWSMELWMSWYPVWQAWALSVGAGVAAAIFPAWQHGREQRRKFRASGMTGLGRES